MTKLVVVGDLEANGLYNEVSVIWCGVFKELKGKRIWKFRPDQIEEMLLFLDSVDVLIMHNGIGYDLAVLDKLFNYKFKGQIVDTLLMSRLQKPSRRLPPNCLNKKAGPHSVEAWGYRVGRGKPEHNDWTQFSPEMLHRCTEDVEIQILIYEALMEEAKGKDWKQAHLLTFQLFKGLSEQERYGWLLDKDYAEKAIKLLTHMMDRVDRVLDKYLPMKLIVEENKVKGEYSYVKKPYLKSGDYSAVVERWHENLNHSLKCRVVGGPFSRIHFRPVNLNSNAETKDFLLDSGWEPEHWNINDDGERTSPKLSHSDPFVGINGAVGRLVARRVQARHRRSQIEGWLRLTREDGRVSARVSGLAETGRAKHAGIVNVPGGDAFFGKQMRKCFTSEEGYVLVGCDSAGCQNRMLAARVGDDFFTDTLVNGSKEAKTSIHHVNQRAIKEVAGIEVSYSKAKTLNYAFMFGASDNKLGLTVGGGQAEGARIREALLSVAAGFAELVEKLTKEWKSNAKKRMNKWNKMDYYDGWVTGLDGRPIFIASEHQILVYVLQSDEAIMMSAAYCFLRKRLSKRYKNGTDFRIVCFYHDEYTIECKEHLAEDIAKIAEQCIVDAGKFYKIECPHQGEAAIGKTWWDIH
jgi:hypothetical protein